MTIQPGGVAQDAKTSGSGGILHRTRDIALIVEYFTGNTTHRAVSLLPAHASVHGPVVVKVVDQASADGIGSEVVARSAERQIFVLRIRRRRQFDVRPIVKATDIAFLDKFVMAGVEL